MSTQLLDKVRYWSEHQCFDSETREHAKRMLQENNQKEIEECFKSVLEFGTGGLRGPMGIGTNRMNRYTVMQATEGLARVIEAQGSGTKNGNSYSGVVIGYDSRNQSKQFAEAAAEVLCAHKIQVFLFSEIAPTPLVSCELIRRSAQAAVIITASHNPHLITATRFTGRMGDKSFLQLMRPLFRRSRKSAELKRFLTWN